MMSVQRSALFPFGCEVHSGGLGQGSGELQRVGEAGNGVLLAMF